MTKEEFVATELHARASEQLAREVEDELAKPDPQGEAAKAAIRDALENSDQNESEGEG
jgi:hypothetical protein